ncbi:MAG: YgiQ family radical SAM protein, partial [Desulfobulbaceae bacterium]|nr:YgiQ family radical SAM protein [Desulfobulbaceae bacterium]
MTFLPTTAEEIKALDWQQADIILISGDTYIDSPFIGIALIGRILAHAGFKVAIIAQPDTDSDRDITRLGEPRLFWGVSGGSVDSMVANYTASYKHRNSDDFTPGGHNTRRPDRAVIAYTNLIRRFFKNTKPVVLGGIETSLRRIAHYDAWSNRVRKSILFDAKADILVYGMAEKTIVTLAERLNQGLDFRNIPGLCHAAANPPEHPFIELPDFNSVATDPDALIAMFHAFYQNNDPITAQSLVQRHDNRYLIQNPPSALLSREELDHIHDLPFTRSVHPYYQSQGKVLAQDTIQFALTTHRGCYGECNFCAIAVHQGRTVISRSPDSILREAQRLTKHPDFKGIILDVGGPTANMYGFECPKKIVKGVCQHQRCLTPKICPTLKINHQTQLKLLRSLRALPGVKRVFVASGVRYDLILADRAKGLSYLKKLVAHQVSGQMKVAPEHSQDQVLALMGKPGINPLLEFKHLFE